STLRLLRAKTAVGRLFSDDETKVGSGRALAVIDYPTWQSRFGGQKDIVGKTLILNGRPHTVIGVTAEGFSDPSPVNVWLPITSAPSAQWLDRNSPNVWAYGRLKPGFTAHDGEEELKSIAVQLRPEHPANGNTSATATDMRQWMTSSYKLMLLTLLGAVGAVLLIVCVNIANLQLARASTRAREMSVRAALGANRGRLISQVLTESVMLSLVGGTLGIILGQFAVKVLLQMMPPLNLSAPITLDSHVMLFSIVITLLTGLLFGAPAALSGSRTNLQNALRARVEHNSSRRFNVRNLLVVAELSLCIVLLVTAGLFTQSLLAMQRISVGFNSERVLTAEFRLPKVKYDNDASVALFMTGALEKLRAIPGVRSAALIDAIPLSGNFGTVSYIAQGQPDVGAGVAPVALSTAVSDQYFKTMEIPLIAGRDFSSNDRAGSEPVAIVNKEFAEKNWPGVSVLGRQVKLFTDPVITVRVVGVVGGVKQQAISEATQPQIYSPKAQAFNIFASVVMRTAGEPEVMSNALREAIWAVDHDQPVWKVRSLETLVSGNLAPAKFSVKLVSAFAFLAFLLGVIGVYGVMSFAVAQRTREVGIRMALGARSDQVLRLVLRSGGEVVAVATIVGVVGALVAGRYLQSQLYNVEATDPTTMIGVPVLLASVALVACWLPARRAARVDPAVTLRNE
ncbi:MAG: ABC transporter permease, partial [Gemmatimonadaceae bacterium]